MSTTIIAVIINILSTVLPWLGVTVGTEELTTTVATLVAIGTGLYIWYERFNRGDISVLGVKK